MIITSARSDVRFTNAIWDCKFMVILGAVKTALFLNFDEIKFTHEST